MIENAKRGKPVVSETNARSHWEKEWENEIEAKSNYKIPTSMEQIMNREEKMVMGK